MQKDVISISVSNTKFPCKRIHGKYDSFEFKLLQFGPGRLDLCALASKLNSFLLLEQRPDFYLQFLQPILLIPLSVHLDY